MRLVRSLKLPLSPIFEIPPSPDSTQAAFAGPTVTALGLFCKTQLVRAPPEDAHQERHNDRKKQQAAEAEASCCGISRLAA